jgi:predicted dehydrogenase
MAGKGQGGAYRVGIAGLDHWYIGLEMAKAAQQNADAELAVVAHRDAERARETAERFGAGEWTTDYASVANRSDLDILITACRTSENAALCVAGARRGTHIISVKPMAMTMEDAEVIREAVEGAGVHFLSYECQYRLGARYKQLKAWIDEGRIGQPVSALYVLRSSTPTQPWPGVQGQTWWLDPACAPGGGWIDHSIYQVDALRWLFGAEVTSVGGLVGNLVHKDLRPPLEDFGVSTLSFGGGQAGILEVTWTAARGAFYSTMQVVGTEGAVILGVPSPNEARVCGRFEGAEGWQTISVPPAGGDSLGALVGVLRNGGTLPAGVVDACRNLSVCLTFYEAAREGRVREVPAI